MVDGETAYGRLLSCHAESLVSRAAETKLDHHFPFGPFSFSSVHRWMESGRRRRVFVASKVDAASVCTKYLALQAPWSGAARSSSTCQQFTADHAECASPRVMIQTAGTSEGTEMQFPREGRSRCGFHGQASAFEALRGNASASDDARWSRLGLAGPRPTILVM
jgi:hypothetical protein